ncbi:MAG TPA: hypothetical protein VJW93_06555 [Candidatus Acidoferrales bacterium]|nr:hypothetical protein [Candidatus Acidoferrales bacterium]
MNVTRNVVEDLVPVYFSGDASEDTIHLVEEYFQQDPQFERSVRAEAGVLTAVGAACVPLPGCDAEKAALNRIRKILRQQRILFGIALTLTLNAIVLGLSLTITDGGTSLHWWMFRPQRVVSGGLLVIATVVWILYFVRGRETGLEPRK